MEKKKSKSGLGLLAHIRKQREIKLEKLIEEIGRGEFEDVSE